MRNVVAIVDFHNVFNRNVMQLAEEQYRSFVTSLAGQIVGDVDDEH